MRRVHKYVKGLLVFAIILAVIFAVLGIIQVLWHPFDGLIDFVNRSQGDVGERLSSDAVAGVSFGSLAVVLVLALIPIFSRGVNNRQYFVSFLRSTLAAGVYFVTDLLYRTVESMGRFYLLLAIVGVVLVTFILVEIVARASHIEKEVAVRTDLMAAIVSGLVFGLLVRLIAYGLQMLSVGHP